MGWRAFNKALDGAIPQKNDSAGDIIGKALTSWVAAPMALLDLFSPEPSSPSGGGDHGGNHSDGNGCHCDCRDHH